MLTKRKYFGLRTPYFGVFENLSKLYSFAASSYTDWTTPTPASTYVCNIPSWHFCWRGPAAIYPIDRPLRILLVGCAQNRSMIAKERKSKSKSHCDWRSVSQLVSRGVEPHLGIMTRYLLLFYSCGLVFMGRSLWREDGSVFYICCWPSPA
jgi:hypothetical protein